MATRIAPDAILLQTNLVGTVTEIQDDPDSPDGSWLDAASDSANTDLSVSFPTPSTTPVIGVGLQNFRCLLRTTGPGDNPIATVFLYESGVLRATGTPTAISSGAGQVVQLSWNASLLVDPTGAGVECRVQGIADGGFLDPDDTVEVGAVEWNAEVVFVASADYRSSQGSNSAYVAEPSAAPDYRSSSGGNCAYVGEPEFGPDFAFRSSLGSNSTYEGVPDFCPTDDERLPPTTILEQTNLVGDLDQIQDDPDTPDGSWWTTPLPGVLLPTAAQVGFDTPSISIKCCVSEGYQDIYSDIYEGDCPADSDMQEFRALVRTTVLGIPPPMGLLAPTARIELWESGFLLDASPEFAITSEVDQLISWSWSPALLSDPTGAGVEARIVGTPAVLDTVGWTVELGAVEWNVAACAGCRYHDSQGGNSSYEPGPLAFSADYRDSQGSNSAFEAIFGPGGVGYVSSDGSNSRYVGNAEPIPPPLPGIRRCDPGPVPATRRRC